jgi:hypothetical protein
MGDFDVFDEWGNFKGKFTPVGGGGEGCLIGIALLAVVFFFWVAYIILKYLFKGLSYLVKNGIKSIKEKNYGAGIAYLLIPSILAVVILFLWIGSISNHGVPVSVSGSQPQYKSVEPSAITNPVTEAPTASQQQQPQQQGFVCGSNLVSQLQVGMIVRVEDETDLCNRIRSGPGTDRSILSCAEPNTKMEIIGGPECSQYPFWKVKILSGPSAGQIGWTAGGDSTRQWLIPVQ